MRGAVGLLLILVMGAFGRMPSLERVAISGSDYGRVGEWASANDFSMKWNRKDGEIELSSPGTNLHLTIDSRRAEIGNVIVWLSLPVVNRGGVAMVSMIDLRTTLEPLLFPHKAGGRLLTICLDPGHGGRDNGEVVGKNYEKKYTLLLAQELEGLLKDDGFEVVMTRNRDESVELGDRPQEASRKGADVFVSLHYNSAPQRDIRGVEVYCLAPAGVNSSNDGGGKSHRPAEMGNIQDERNVLLAYQMQKSITRSLPVEDRGIKRSHFEVLRESHMPAILIEGGFMTNPQDARNIYDGVYRHRMALAIVDGLKAYRRVTERIPEHPAESIAQGNAKSNAEDKSEGD